MMSRQSSSPDMHAACEDCLLTGHHTEFTASILYLLYYAKYGRSLACAKNGRSLACAHLGAYVGGRKEDHGAVGGHRHVAY
eukprot:COSAG02_NODE_41539_length_393_cov_1.057823_1_plen_80_part_10